MTEPIFIVAACAFMAVMFLIGSLAAFMLAVDRAPLVDGMTEEQAAEFDANLKSSLDFDPRDGFDEFPHGGRTVAEQKWIARRNAAKGKR